MKHFPLKIYPLYGIGKKAVDMTEDELNDYISHFVHEAVKQDGCSPYPPNHFYQIIEIQRHLKESSCPDVAFLMSLLLYFIYNARLWMYE